MGESLGGLGDGEKSRAVFWGAFRGSAEVRGGHRKIKLELASPEAEETGLGSKGGPAVRLRG